MGVVRVSHSRETGGRDHPSGEGRGVHSRGGLTMAVCQEGSLVIRWEEEEEAEGRTSKPTKWPTDYSRWLWTVTVTGPAVGPGEGPLEEVIATARVGWQHQAVVGRRDR